MSFDNMLEIAEQLRGQGSAKKYRAYPGPDNIGYWPWWTTQVLILDDISPVVVAAVRHGAAGSFGKLLEDRLGNIASELSARHTIWVFGGDEIQNTDALVKELSEAIQDFCGSDDPPIVVRLSKP